MSGADRRDILTSGSTLGRIRILKLHIPWIYRFTCVSHPSSSPAKGDCGVGKMRAIHWAVVLLLCGFCGACSSAGGNEALRFQAQKTQQVMMRDGESTITSRALNSIVTMRPADRKPGSRQVFIVGIQNISRKPLEFRVANVSAMQTVGGQPSAQLRVFTYEELAQEEQNAQVGRAVLVGVLGGVGAGLAGRNQGLQDQFAYQNAVLASQVSAAGQQNLAALEQLAIKDQTVLP